MTSENSGWRGMNPPTALAEQADMAYRDVSRFDDNVELGARDQRKVDRLLTDYRARHAVFPIEHEGVLAGPDGSYTMGNNDARWNSYRGSDDLPKYDPDNPWHTQVPFIVPAWNLNDEWAVRAPNTIEDIIGGFTLSPRLPCDWHRGSAKAGRLPPAVMVRTQGQIILLAYVCGSCRVSLTKMYGGGFVFLELDDNRQIRVSLTAE